MNNFKPVTESLVLIIFIISIQSIIEINSIIPQATSLTIAMPSAPQNLQATAGTGNVTLTWQAPSNGGSPITNYKIYRSSSSGTEGLYTTIRNVTSYTNTGLPNGKTYFLERKYIYGVGASFQTKKN